MFSIIIIIMFIYFSYPVKLPAPIPNILLNTPIPIFEPIKPLITEIIPLPIELTPNIPIIELIKPLIAGINKPPDNIAAVPPIIEPLPIINHFLKFYSFITISHYILFL